MSIGLDDTMLLCHKAEKHRKLDVAQSLNFFGKPSIHIFHGRVLGVASIPGSYK
jgi:hypothetical protein